MVRPISEPQFTNLLSLPLLPMRCGCCIGRGVIVFGCCFCGTGNHSQLASVQENTEGGDAYLELGSQSLESGFCHTGKCPLAVASPISTENSLTIQLSYLSSATRLP